MYIQIRTSVVLEWKVTSNRCILDLQTTKAKGKDEIMRSLRDKADTIYKEVIQHWKLFCTKY